MSNWIAVGDRLPLEPSHSRIYQHLAVLATDGSRVELCHFDGGNGAGEPWVSWNSYNALDAQLITHWMPLPEPPK